MRAQFAAIGADPVGGTPEESPQWCSGICQVGEGRARRQHQAGIIYFQ